MSVVYSVKDSGSGARYEGLGVEVCRLGSDLGIGYPKTVL